MQSRLDKFFWLKSFLTTMYIINMLHISCLNNDNHFVNFTKLHLINYFLYRCYLFFLSNVRTCIDQKWNKAENQRVKIYMFVQSKRTDSLEQAPFNTHQSRMAINIHKKQTSSQWKHMLGDPKTSSINKQRRISFQPSRQAWEQWKQLNIGCNCRQ